MHTKLLVEDWFTKWASGHFNALKIAEDFSHTSPYGTITGKANYLSVVEDNLDKFLGHSFDIKDALYDTDKACIRYTARKEDFELHVCEWHYCQNGLIQNIFSYYNIEGEISEERKLRL